MSTAAGCLFAVEPELSADEFIAVLHRSTLAERRPVEDRETISGMLSGADIIVTARTTEGLLIGVSRAISDRHWCTYLSDLAVDQAFQQQGVGRALIHQTHLAAGLKTHLILLAAPAAQNYYPRIGMQPHHSCWTIPRESTA